MQVPSVCRASYSGQQQPALAPAAGRAPHSLENRTQSCTDSCSLLWCNSHWAHVASSRLQKSPLLGLFAAASACILTLEQALPSAQAAALMPPFHHQYSQFTSSGTPYAFHSPTAILPSVSTGVKLPSLQQTSPIFGSIFSLYIL